MQPVPIRCECCGKVRTKASGSLRDLCTTCLDECTNEGCTDASFVAICPHCNSPVEDSGRCRCGYLSHPESTVDA